MTMIEKAAEAAFEALKEAGVDGPHFEPLVEGEPSEALVDGTVDLRIVVRAVLASIRDLDDAACADVHDNDQLQWPDPARGNIRNVWSGVIDAILEGK